MSTDSKKLFTELSSNEAEMLSGGFFYFPFYGNDNDVVDVDNSTVNGGDATQTNNGGNGNQNAGGPGIVVQG
ncbi:hypothetical protein [Acaryochloris sp. IP29b_bin.148]|uniref:hypothetical protein n=1 Tax=Acaryochloris sp. IP29b_bin.148 TaxID=2969218 RepID=UPI0026283FAC|nr:hypothetical protein [Acaryochloris sp. IP29b_bin.148]